MPVDGLLDFDGVTLSNINKLTLKQSRLEEQRICEIALLASEVASAAKDMLDDGYGIYEVLSVISDASLDTVRAPHPGILPENVSRISNRLGALLASDRALFSELLVESLLALGAPLKEADFLLCQEGQQTFTYVKNLLADEAYDVFSQDFSEPRLKYSSTLVDAVSKVVQGECGYCLVPFEERGGARITIVENLIFREDLKINSVTPVFGPEGSSDMKYALLAKHFVAPSYRPDDDRYLELRFKKDSSLPLSELLSAFSAFGASLYRVNTLVLEADESRSPYYSVVIRQEGADFTVTFAFLTLFSGAFTPVGIYKNLE